MLKSAGISWINNIQIMNLFYSFYQSTLSSSELRKKKVVPRLRVEALSVGNDIDGDVNSHVGFYKRGQNCL